MIRAAFLLPALAMLVACSGQRDDGPVAASMIGEPPRIVDPSQKPLSPASALLLAATAQGLVRFDATGQIEPGLAIRWDVSDDGLYYTFRIADSRQIDAEQVARWLRAAIGPTSRNPLKPVLGAIQEIVAVTPEVIEIRLGSPRPDLLTLLAQPEMAVLARGAGTGPFRIAERGGDTMLLTPTDPLAVDAEPEAMVRRQVRLRVERAARAVARFAAGDTALVLGGRFGDLAIAHAANRPADALHVDPAFGLFGLAVSDRGGFVGVADNRRALSMAIDRTRLATAFGAVWRPVATLIPVALADRPVPATPDWIDAPLDQRRSLARATIASWAGVAGAPPTVRIALPEGPGSRLLFARLASDWAAIGVVTVRVPRDEDADLVLVDKLAPGDSASWYLRQFECVRAIACSLEADRSLTSARTAATLAERAALLAEADDRLSEISAFIPLAAPLRWSLVSRRLPAFQDNKRSVHPLDQLRGE